MSTTADPNPAGEVVSWPAMSVGEVSQRLTTTYQVTGDGYAPEGKVTKDGKPAGQDPVLGHMGRVSILCNDAQLLHQEGGWKVAMCRRAPGVMRQPRQAFAHQPAAPRQWANSCHRR